MTERERFEAVRRVREEADKLRLACIALSDGKALLHIAFDAGTELGLSIAETALIGSLRAVP